MQLDQGATHYMVVRGSTTGLTRASFTFHLIEDGSDRADIAVDIREVRPRTYVASFTNDGDAGSQWTLVVYETATPGTAYTQSWIVKTSPVEADVRFIKSQF